VSEDVDFPINKDVIFNVPDDLELYWIYLIAIDQDISEDDYIDINGEDQAYKGISLGFNLSTKTWSGGDSDGVANGSEDGTQDTDDDDGILYYDLSLIEVDYKKEYKWSYDGYIFTVFMDFNNMDYILNKSKDRQSWDIQEYVNSDADYIVELASKLNDFADSRGYTGYERVDFVLSFVQNIKYSYDNETSESDDYWRYPIETLVDEAGDCEDSSFLFASIMEAMGYDAVCLNPPGHMAVGIYSQNHTGWYITSQGKDYYYCETTSPGWKMGDMPEIYQGETFNIYPVE
jgi:hypothetical protein